MIWLLLGNLARRVGEWADRQGDRGERHIIDVMRESWVVK